jgi:flagellar hook protein FlgE
MVNNQGHYLQGYEINTDGTPKAVSINATKPIQVPDRAGEPKMTELVEASFNLSIESKTKPTDPAAFDPTNSATFAHSTSVTIYDSLGAPHVITKYFVRHEDPVTPGTPMTPGTWSMYMYEGDKPIDIASGAPSPGPGIPTGVQMTFTSGGKLDPALTIPAPPAPIKTVTLGTAAGIINNGADPTQAVEIRLSDVTQYNSPFNVTKLTQDGATVGNLTKVEITPDGIVSATYSNATTLKVAMVALAKFANSQGLTQVGDTSWRQSLLSGDALPGTPNSGTLGSIKSSAVEQSNVDLTTQLVNLITAQRNFQANSRSLEVNSSLQQTILQIR